MTRTFLCVPATTVIGIPYFIVGPKSDPAKVHGMNDSVAALKKIAAAKAPFASRGDRSGTHVAELNLWKAAGLDPAKDKPSWYRETGSGMGATLNTAAGMEAYALTDRGTWLSFRNPGELEIAVEGDAKLFNQYGVILVSPAKHPNVKAELGQRFVDWLIGPEGQRAIASSRSARANRCARRGPTARPIAVEPVAETSGTFG